jgi:hypothetical protein
VTAALGLGIYVNSETVPFYLQAIGIDISQSQRISAYHTPFPNNTQWLDDLHSRYDSSDRIIVFCSELHESTVASLLSLDLPRVELYICGVIASEFKHAQVHRWMDWFHTSATFYREHPTVLDRLNPFDAKPLHFDMLLGCQRPNRDYVYNYVIEHDLKSQVLLTYFKFWNMDLRQSDQFIPEEAGLEYIEAPNGTVHQVRYYGRRMCLSQVIPIEIYNRTAYTLVTETNGVNHFNFYTEKIVKPILAQRLFVAIAGRHYLRNLRAMGFQTFDGIIDESYDEVEDNWERYTSAMAQVERLCRMPQEEILVAIRPIVEHNRRLMLEQDWYYNPNT